MRMSERRAVLFANIAVSARNRRAVAISLAFHAVRDASLLD